jgi:hypothetical protein
MTITGVPDHRTDIDETRLLFEEARRRRRRRRLATGIATIAIVVLLGIVGLLVAVRGGAPTRPVSGSTLPAAGRVGTASSALSLRPVYCYAPAYSGPAGRTASSSPLPSCAPSSMLTPAHLEVAPRIDDVEGYTANSDIQPDPQFATIPSTTASTMALPGDRNQEVLLPGGPGEGTGRYVLGPVGLGRSAIASARATRVAGQWTIYLRLTDRGAATWDALAEKQFHAIVGVVVDGRVVSAPITEPTQSSFTSFQGVLQISGGFSRHQARAIASSL